jgi:hypothetical protein
VDVLAGIAVVLILTFETFYGRFSIFQPRELKPGQPAPTVPAGETVKVSA